MKNCVDFVYCHQKAFSNIVQIRVVPITKKCTRYYLQKLDIKPGKICTDESTFEGNQKGDVVPGTVDKNQSIYGFVIDGHGNFGSVNGET